jgi:hypothetical protein
MQRFPDNNIEVQEYFKSLPNLPAGIEGLTIIRSSQITASPTPSLIDRDSTVPRTPPMQLIHPGSRPPPAPVHVAPPRKKPPPAALISESKRKISNSVDDKNFSRPKTLKNKRLITEKKVEYFNHHEKRRETKIRRLNDECDPELETQIGEQSSGFGPREKQSKEGTGRKGRKENRKYWIYRSQTRLAH